MSETTYINPETYDSICVIQELVYQYEERISRAPHLALKMKLNREMQSLKHALKILKRS